MNQTRQAIHQAPATQESRLSRADRHSAALVKKGITLQQIHGTEYAAEFLKEKDIDIEIVMRVLLGVSAKRRYDDPLDHAALDSAADAGSGASFDATLDANPGWSAIDSSKSV